MTDETTPLPGAAGAAGSPTATAPDLAIRTIALTKIYEGRKAIDAIDLHVRRGDIYGYIGPNGAGKTTTIRILSALLLPTSGMATICGVDVVKNQREIKRLVGYMPDSFGVYENMTLFEYLEFFAMAYKIDRHKRGGVIRDVLELTDLGPKKDDWVSAFSKGMKQRACLAKTLLHDPQVLILDEPASGLDPRARVEFRELLRELQKMGKTILVSSHILTELATVCNSIGIIEAGRLVAQGDVGSILKELRRGRQFTLALLDGSQSDRAAAWLGAQRVVVDVKPGERGVVFDVDGSDEDVASIVDGLLAEGLRFVSLREEIVDLETAFMTLTKGELA